MSYCRFRVVVAGKNNGSARIAVTPRGTVFGSPRPYPFAPEEGYFTARLWSGLNPVSPEIHNHNRLILKPILNGKGGSRKEEDKSSGSESHCRLGLHLWRPWILGPPAQKGFDEELR